jgi:simple sugar transport system substrate-binding protein
MADGRVKVAILRNMDLGDHARQFLEGCVSEGRSLGFTVDTFISGGDNERCKTLAGGIAAADYDGLVFSHGPADMSYAILKPLADRGIKIVTFDALPFIAGEEGRGILPGITSTAQDDEKLARLSLDALLSGAAKDSGVPVRVIRVWWGPGVPPLDKRQKVYDEYVREGKITEAALVGPARFTFARSGTRDALRAILPGFPEGSVDAIWAPYDEFAKGCADALHEAARADIRLFSVDISSDDLRLMQDRAAYWLAAAAVNPRLIGVVNMRILAAKLAGEETPPVYTFDAQLIETRRLSGEVNMVNIGQVISGWGEESGHFDFYPWMGEIKEAAGNILK